MFEFAEKIQAALEATLFKKKPRAIKHILQKSLNHDDLKTHANSIFYFLDDESFVQQKNILQNWCVLVCIHNANSQICAKEISKEADQYINPIKQALKKGNAHNLGNLDYVSAAISSYEPTFLVVKLNFLYTKNINC